MDASVKRIDAVEFPRRDYAAAIFDNMRPPSRASAIESPVGNNLEPARYGADDAPGVVIVDGIVFAGPPEKHPQGKMTRRIEMEYQFIDEHGGFFNIGIGRPFDYMMKDFLKYLFLSKERRKDAGNIGDTGPVVPQIRKSSGADITELFDFNRYSCP